MNGHVFDAGPTVITAPWLFDELFELFGERRADAIEFLPCDPWYRLLYADGTQLDLVPSIERQEAEIARLSPKDAAHYREYLASSEALYRVGYEQLGDADFSTFGSMVRALPHLLKLGGFKSLWRHTAAYFSDPRVRQAFSLQPLLVGGNPLTTTAIYGLIHAMERRGGIWFAKGGTGQLIRQLVNLATRNGVRFHFGCRVTGFTTDRSNRLTAVSYVRHSQRHSLGCELGVWGGDPQGAYRLLGSDRLSVIEKVRSRTVRSSMGLYVLYFRAKRRYPDVAHHTIVLSERWEGLLKEIFAGTKLPADPSLYLHRPATTDPDFEKGDGDSFYVLAPVPHLGLFNSWEQSEERFREVVLKILEERVLPDVRAELLFAESVDPRYFKNTLHSPLGAGFSIAPILSQSAWFRFHNQSDKVQNLYLCGAGVHPGGGLPGVVTSAKVVERLVLRDLSSFASRVPNSFDLSQEVAS
jgi:phytoene desaturase